MRARHASPFLFSMEGRNYFLSPTWERIKVRGNTPSQFLPFIKRDYQGFKRLESTRISLNPSFPKREIFLPPLPSRERKNITLPTHEKAINAKNRKVI
jgi:hypothetical protein